MPSFDIASKTDLQTLDNSINVARKEILGRFDFKGSNSIIELDKKNVSLTITTEDEMRLDSIIDALRSRMIKQKLDPRCMDVSKEHYSSGMLIKKEIKIREGIDKENSKKLIKIIKDSKLKVTAQIMDDIIRVSGKKIDDLQGVIAVLRRAELEIPLQFINMK
jgi:uncharacterized protein YajQ (UPF0234 family)